MCGIAGLWAPGSPPAERQALVSAMLGRLVHRGPDGIALWSGADITLGLTRLAIVAAEEPARILANETGRIHAAVNGEVYNYRELRTRLRERGHRVPTGPDTAVIAHLYEQQGADFPTEIDGMFAAAVWDADRHRLVLARDRAGEKPLFLNRTGSRFAFASEPAALLGLPWISRDPSAEGLARYLLHGFFAGSDAGFAALRQLPPGSVMEIGEGVERCNRYWRPWDGLADGVRSRGARRDTRRIVQESREGLEAAVRSRLPEHMPFGVFLSGGLDSSLVAALAARAGRRFPTFSVKMVGRHYDESAYARRVADHLGANHHELVMDHHSGREAIESYCEIMDHPLGDPSIVPTWALSRFASPHVPVILSGEGADELFAGYPTYLGHRHAALVDRLPAWASAAVLAAARRLGTADHHLSPAYLIERFLSARGMDPLERHVTWFGNSDPDQAHALLSPALRDGLDRDEVMAHLTRLAGDLRAAGLGEIVDRGDLVLYQIADFVLYLGGGLLSKLDRSAMAHGIESRTPFLRHELIDLALSLPDSAKLRGGSGKWVLKRIAREFLPASVISRRKQGFSPPFSAWARGPLRDYVVQRLSAERVRHVGLLDHERVTRLLERHLSGQAECGRALWTLLSLQLWAERWVLNRSGTFPGRYEGEAGPVAAPVSAAAPRPAMPSAPVAPVKSQASAPAPHPLGPQRSEPAPASSPLPD